MSTEIMTDQLRKHDTVLEARGLKKSYGTSARKLEILIDVNLVLREG